MQYELILTGKFKKSLKLARKRGLDISLLEVIVTMLQNNIPLEEKYRDHELKENTKDLESATFNRIGY